MSSDEIKSVLEKTFATIKIEVEDDSFRHRNHKQSQGQGGHYNLLIVSDDFVNVDLATRHRKIYEALQLKDRNHIHALSIQALTQQEWERKK